MTNGDRFRLKTDEEIAYQMTWPTCPPAKLKDGQWVRSGCQEVSCIECWLRWLKADEEVSNPR